jgi:hypothetical protein
LWTRIYWFFLTICQWAFTDMCPFQIKEKIFVVIEKLFKNVNCWVFCQKGNLTYIQVVKRRRQKVTLSVTNNTLKMKTIIRCNFWRHDNCLSYLLSTKISGQQAAPYLVVFVFNIDGKILIVWYLFIWLNEESYEIGKSFTESIYSAMIIEIVSNYWAFSVLQISS